MTGQEQQAQQRDGAVIVGAGPLSAAQVVAVARHGGLEVGVVEDRALLERRRVDRGDGDRHLLDVFRHASGGHDDFFDAAGRCSAFRPCRRRSIRKPSIARRRSLQSNLAAFAAEPGTHLTPISTSAVN